MLAVARGPGPTMQQYGAALASNAVASSSRITLDAPPNAPPDAPPDDDASSPARRPRSRSASAAPKRFVCGYAGCGKAYAKPARLKEHEAVHTGEVGLGPSLPHSPMLTRQPRPAPPAAPPRLPRLLGDLPPRDAPRRARPDAPSAGGQGVCVQLRRVRQALLDGAASPSARAGARGRAGVQGACRR